MSLDYKENFEQIKIAGNLAASTLDAVTPFVKPGVSTDQLDKICYEFIRDNNGYSAPLFYRGFPKSCCTSANHIVCHGIPSDKHLKEGDIGESIQTYVEKKGFSVVRDFCGHGTGKIFHEPPNILHYGKKGVKILCYDCKLNNEEIRLNNQISYEQQL